MGKGVVVCPENNEGGLPSFWEGYGWNDVASAKR
jgi:hypothetical protein